MLRSESRFDELNETAKIPPGDELSKTVKNRGEYTNHMEPEHTEDTLRPSRVVCVGNHNFYLCEISGLVTEEKYNPSVIIHFHLFYEIEIVGVW